MSPAIIVFIILAASIVLFVTEVFPPFFTAILVPIALIWTGVLPLPAAVAGFTNSTVVLLVSMFVVGAAMMDTGIAWKIAHWMMPLAKTERQATVVFFVISAAISAFLPNVGVAVMMFPVVLTYARMKKFQPSTVLMPYIFGCNIGGIVTMMGSSFAPFLQSSLEEFGSSYVIGFFDFTKFGLPTVVACAIYLGLIGYKFYPHNGLDVKGDVEVGDDDYSHVPAWKQIAVVLCIVCIAGAMIIGAPYTQVAMGAAALLVVCRVLTAERALTSINQRTVYLFAGMYALSDAMKLSGAVDIVADGLANLVPKGAPAFLLVCAMWLAVNLVSEFMTSNAAMMLMLPVCLQFASIMGCSPVPLILALFAGGVSCNATPYAASTNTMVYEPGGYKFKDYVINGLPITIICGIVSCICITIFFPLYG